MTATDRFRARGLMTFATLPSARRWQLAIGFVALSVVVLALPWSSSEPVFQGRGFSSWLADLDHGRPPAVRAPAVAALRAMGTNALPPLLRLLRTRDSEFKRRVRELAERQPLIRIRSVSAQYHQKRALNGFQVLGAAAAPAVPALAEMLQQDETAANAVFALVQIGPAAVPPMRGALTGSRPATREAAAWGLGMLRGAARPAIPDLLKLLRDDEKNLRIVAADALGNIHGEPDAVVPALAELLQDEDALIRSTARSALAKFGEDAEFAAESRNAVKDR